MSLSEKLSTQLQNILAGEPWYGSSVYEIIEKISFEAAFEKPQGSVHNIAEIVLHMIAWTEEVMDRMNGMSAGIPTSGDWPEVGAPDEQKWQNYVEDLKLVSVNLIGIIQKFPQEQWDEPIKDERNRQLGTGVSYEELINGLIQHHIYHSGQMALLNRILGF
jgi:uncharacterized damage-inducible protein DinB